MPLGKDTSSVGAAREATGSSAESSRHGLQTDGGSGKLGNAAARLWVFDARGRVSLVIAGDLALMYRSGLAAPKALYFLVVILAAVAALPAVREVFRDHSRTADRRLVIAAAAIGALAVLSLPVARYHHNAPSDWIRDVAVYGLLAVAPALAIDLRRSAGIRWVSWALIASGALAAISFAVYWATARGYAHLPGHRDLLLPTWYLAAALFAYASARAISTVGRARMIWALVAFAVFLSSIVTGTRSSVILVAAPIAQLLMSRHRRALAVGVCVVVLIAAAFSLAQNRGVDLGGVGNRLSSAAAFVRNPGTDPSWKLRIAETHNAVKAWRTSPVLGVGAGHIFHWTLSGIHEGRFLIDSPAGFLAKFGLIGVLVLLGFLVAVALVVRQRLRSGELDSVLPLVGLGAVVLCGFVFGMPLEDKGFPVAFLLTYALTLPGARDISVPEPELRRRAWALAAAVGVVCVIAAATGSRIDRGSPKPSLLGPTSPSLLGPTSPSLLGPTSPPVHVVAAYEEALWAGDGSRACRLLAPSMQARDWGSFEHCRAALSEARGASVFADSRASAPVLVRRSPRTLKILVTRRDGTATLYRVARRHGGRWIIIVSTFMPHPKG